MNAVTSAAPVSSHAQPKRPALLRVLGAVLAALLLLLGLGLAALCLGRFAALGGGGPLWLGTLAAAELVVGQLIFGDKYTAWDGFYRALGLALLASLCLGLSGWAWPRRRTVRVAAVQEGFGADHFGASAVDNITEPNSTEPNSKAALYSFKYRDDTETGEGSVH